MPNIPNDGNGDSIKDVDQPNVVSIPDKSSGSYITLVFSKTVTVNEIYTDLTENQEFAADGYVFPQGLIYFELEGSEVEVTAYYHGVRKLRTTPSLQKFGTKVPGDMSTLEWYKLPNVTFAVVKVGSESVVTATYQLKDGGLGDNTGVDGRIIDPNGLVFGDF